MANKGQKFRKWSNSEKEEIINLNLNGYSLKQIAKKFNSTTGSITTIINNYKTNKTNNTKMPYKIKYSLSQDANDLFVGILHDYNKKLVKENEILKKQWDSGKKIKTIKK